MVIKLEYKKKISSNPMKRIRIVKLLTFIYYSTLIGCSDGDYRCHEIIIKVIETKEYTKPAVLGRRMSFSFDKKNFNDFRCDFDNDIISFVSIKVPPYYIASKNLSNFTGIFGLFFQYSLIKNNEEFRKAVESCYENYLKKINDINEDKPINTQAPNNFKNYLKNLDNIIKGMLDNKGYGMVKLRENNGRIIIFYNNRSPAKLFNFKLVKILSENIIVKHQRNKEIFESMTEFYTKFYEYYLNDLLNPGFAKSLNEIFRNKNEIMIKQPIKETKLDNDPFKFLLNSYSRFCQLINNESIDECKESYDEKTSIYSKKYQQYLDLMEKLYFSGELPERLKELIPKTTAKYVYEITKVSFEARQFFCNSSEYNINVFTLCLLLEKALRYSKMISFEGECLE